MPYWHITLASRGRTTLFPTERELRVGVGKLVAAHADQALLYAIVDDHLHDVVDATTRRDANEVSRRIQRRLRPVSRAPFVTHDVAPVETRAHLKSLVRYVLTQPEHHELTVHPALWTGSCFLDLCGARYLPGASLKLKEALPRLRWIDLLEMLGLENDPLLPATDSELFEVGLSRIAQATSSALNIAPDFARGGQATIVGKRCVVQLARQASFKRIDLERAFGWPARSIDRYRAATVPAHLSTAIRRRISLERLVKRTARTKGEGAVRYP